MKNDIVKIVKKFIDANIGLLLLLSYFIYDKYDHEYYNIYVINKFCIFVSFCFITYQFRLEQYKEIKDMKIFILINVANIIIYNPWVNIFPTSYLLYVCLLSALYCSFLTVVNDSATVSAETVYTAIEYDKPLEKIKSYIIRMHDIDNIYYNPLLKAIEHKNHELVLFILNRGADVNIIKDNITPLLQAVKNNDVYIANVLISKGANVNYEYCGQTILDYAIYLDKSKEIIELLKNNGGKQFK